MRNIFIALVMSVLSLSAIAGPRFGDWVVNDNGESIYNSVYEADGKQSMVQITKAGFVSIFVVPVNYKADDGAIKTGTTNGVVVVNGTRVKFEFDSYSDGMIMANAKTRKGNEHLQNILWGSSRINFIFPNGNAGWMSARGVQKAWRYLQASEAI